jgi:hypothetical protein
MPIKSYLNGSVFRLRSQGAQKLEEPEIVSERNGKFPAKKKRGRGVGMGQETDQTPHMAPSALSGV